VSLPDSAAVERWRRDLLSAAILGTDRRPFPDSPFADTASGPPDDEVLARVAVAAALVRAGRRPTVADPVTPATAESSPYAPPSAIELLGVLIDAPPIAREVRIPLLNRWLQTAADRDAVVPPRFLPTLIALAGTAPELLPSLQRAWGRRGDWLAEKSGTAARPSTPDAADLGRDWARLRTTDAVDALAALREGDPHGARELTAAHWSELPAALKERVLESWRVGLSAADEPFLDALLDERSARVRDAARALLRGLPTSAFGTRMAGRLAPLLTVERARVFASNTRITVLAPTVLDDAATRDGLAGVATAADRAASLQTVLTAAPLRAWCEATGLSVERIVAAVRDDDAVLGALIRATTDQRNTEWARALLSVRRDPSLIRTLPDHEREQYLLRLLPTDTDVGFRELLGLAGAPWSPPIADAILARVTRPTPRGRSSHVPLLQIHHATRFPAESVPRIREVLARAELPGADVEISERLRRVLTTAVTYHSFDRSIQEAFS